MTADAAAAANCASCSSDIAKRSTVHSSTSPTVALKLSPSSGTFTQSMRLRPPSAAQLHSSAAPAGENGKLSLERLQPRRDPLRCFARRRNRRLQRLAHRAPMHAMLVGQRPNRQPVNPVIAANLREQLHPRPHPPTSPSRSAIRAIRITDHGQVGPVQAVAIVSACRKGGPNQTVTTTPRRHAGGATSSRPPGANSGWADSSERRNRTVATLVG